MDGFTESGEARYIAIFVELVSLYMILIGIKNKEAKTIVNGLPCQYLEGPHTVSFWPIKVTVHR